MKMVRVNDPEDIAQWLIDNTASGTTTVYHKTKSIHGALLLSQKVVYVLQRRLAEIEAETANTTSTSPVGNTTSITCLNHDTLKLIFGFLNLTSVANLRVSSKELFMPRCPVDFTTYQVNEMFKQSSGRGGNGSLSHNSLTTYDIIKATCQYKIHHSSEANCSCEAAAVLKSISIAMTPAGSSNIISHSNMSESQTFTALQLKSLGFDYSWEVYGLSLDNYFHTKDFHAAVLKLCGFHSYCFLKKLHFGEHQQNILDVLNKHKEKLPLLEEIVFLAQEEDAISSSSVQNNLIGNLHCLKEMDSLKVLSFANATMEGDIYSISNFTRIKYLNLEHTRVNGNLNSISKLTTLEHLHFKQMVAIRGHLSSIRYMTKLVYLELSENLIFGSIDSLVCLLLLEKLRLHKCYQVSGNIANLQKNERLKFLELTHTKVVGNISDLCSLSQLTNVYLSHSMVDRPTETEIDHLLSCTKVRNLFYKR